MEINEVIRLNKRSTHSSQQISACLKVEKFIVLEISGGPARVSDIKIADDVCVQGLIEVRVNDNKSLIERSDEFIGLCETEPLSYRKEFNKIGNIVPWAPKNVRHRNQFSNRPRKSS